MCNDPYTVEVQEDEEVEPDNEVDAGRQSMHCRQPRAFPPIATQEVALRGSLQGAKP